jgi:exonuclease VII small subunit
VKRAEWNRIVIAVEDATAEVEARACAWANAFRDLQEAERNNDEAAELLRLARQRLKDAISEYGDAEAQRAKDGGTDEDRAASAPAGGGA